MTRPHPDLWHAIAALLVALRTLLRATAPDAFSAISRDDRAQLAAITALARRYLHILAAEIVLPPPRRAAPRPETPVPAAPSAQRRAHFQLFELAHAATGKSAATDPPELQ